MVYYPVQCLTVQATPFCNLDCKYCYLPNRSNKGQFDVELIPTLFKNLIDSELLDDELLWDWHAGEPLVCGIDFYKKTHLQIQKHKPKNCTIHIGMQTNATLITEEIAQFFKENNYRIGVSIDGPEELHNNNRVTRKNKGSFTQVMKGVALLQKYQVPFHVICVLSKTSLQHPHEIYKFFYHLGITGLAFNIEEVEGIHTDSSVQGADNLFVTFFDTLFHLHLQNQEPFPIREWEKFTTPLETANINGTTIPFTHLTIDINGNFSTFSPELITIENVKHHTNFIFGNIQNGLITDALQSAHFKTVFTEIQDGVNLCKATCHYFNTCGGGMVSNKLFENGTFASTTTMSCILMEQKLKDLIGHIVIDQNE
jgi:uncharacterized protein